MNELMFIVLIPVFLVSVVACIVSWLHHEWSTLRARRRYEDAKARAGKSWAQY